MVRKFLAWCHNNYYLHWTADATSKFLLFLPRYSYEFLLVALDALSKRWQLCLLRLLPTSSKIAPSNTPHCGKKERIQVIFLFKVKLWYNIDYVFTINLWKFLCYFVTVLTIYNNTKMLKKNSKNILFVD